MSLGQKWKQGYLEKRRAADGECWFLRYRDERPDGKQARRRVRIGLVSDYPSRAAATKAARHLRDQINQPQSAAIAQARRFGDVIARYLLEEIPARHSTQRNYRKMIRLYIGPRWGAAPLFSVKASAVRSWLMGSETAHLSPRSRSHIHGLMKSLFRFAMLWEWYPQGENPMALFWIPGGSKREKLPRVLVPEQFVKLLDVLKGEPFRTLVIAAIFLGLRCSELFALKWKDFDFLGNRLYIERAIVEGHEGEVKTLDSQGYLPLDERLAKVFKSYRQVAILRGDDDWVFASPMTAGEKPLMPNNVQYRILRPAGKAIGLEFSLGWHAFRHTYKSWMDRAGGQPAVMKILMRHADIRTTEQVYGEVKMDQMRDLNSRVIDLILGGQK